MLVSTIDESLALINGVIFVRQPSCINVLRDYHSAAASTVVFPAATAALAWERLKPSSSKLARRSLFIWREMFNGFRCEHSERGGGSRRVNGE